MSLASSTNRVDYIGNGTVDTYAYTFRIFSNTDLLVTIRDTNGAETELTLTTHYTVTGVGEASGGNVVLVSGSFNWLDADGDLLTDYVITIRRVRPLTQSTDIRNQGSFFPETHEDAFDHFVMIDQQQDDELSRSAKLPETLTSAEFDPTLPVTMPDNPGLAIVVNDDGDGFSLAADTGSITVPVSIGNGGTNSPAALNNNRIMKSSGGAIVEAAAITASRALASDSNGIPVAVATTSTELGYLSGVTAAIQTQLNGLFKYRLPEIQWTSVTTVALESGINGTAGDVQVMFHDGTVRTDTSTTRTTFNITRNAVLTTSGAQSGLRTSLSEATNTYYALYAVKVTDSSTQFVTVGDTLLPIPANYATLNSNFGTNGWVYLGMIRNGDNDIATGDILKFKKSGNYTQLYNAAGSGAGVTPRGSNLASSASTTQLTYTYSIGVGAANIPDHFVFTEYLLEHGNTANDTYIGNAADSYQIWRVVSTGRVANTVLLPSVDGANIRMNSGATSARIWIVGWIDGALGVGPNPLL